MAYNEKDFKNCLFNPLNKQPILEAYPQLMVTMIVPIGIIPDVYSGQTDKILRYIFAMYDSNSPLITQEKVMEQRQIAAAEVAGFDPKADFAFREELFSFRDTDSVLLIMQYLKNYPKSRLWAMIVSSEAAFWNATQQMMLPYSELDVMKCIAAQDKTNERLNDFYKQFYDGAPGLEEATKKVQRVTPESIALNGKQ